MFPTGPVSFTLSADIAVPLLFNAISFSSLCSSVEVNESRAFKREDVELDGDGATKIQIILVIYSKSYTTVTENYSIELHVRSFMPPAWPDSFILGVDISVSLLLKVVFSALFRSAVAALPFKREDVELDVDGSTKNQIILANNTKHIQL